MSSQPRFTIRPARSFSDVSTIVGLIDHAALWLRSKPTDQWEKPWPSVGGRLKRIHRGLNDGHTWIVWRGEEAVATVSITARGNELLWKDEEREKQAVYLHRLVVHRDHAGSGLGRDLIAWAAEWGRREYDATELRIDVWADNKDLHRYYRGIGFKFVDFDDDGEPALRQLKHTWPSGMLLRRHISRSDEARWPMTDRFVLECQQAPAGAHSRASTGTEERGSLPGKSAQPSRTGKRRGPSLRPALPVLILAVGFGLSMLSCLASGRGSFTL